MKGIKIEIENEQPMYLYRPYDVICAIAHALYYTANPDSEMCVPNCAYEKAEKMFAEWRDETREKKAVELLKSYEGYINDIPLVIDPCKMCKIYKKHKGWFMGEFKNGEWEEGTCKECCWFYDSKFEVGK